MCLVARAQSPERFGAVPPGVLTDTAGLVPGDSLPDWFWDVELVAIDTLREASILKLRDYKDTKLLVLDFWATYCSPCVNSLEKWDTMLRDFDDQVAVVGIHLYHYNHVVLPFVEKRGWSLPIALGNRADTLLNELFYAKHRFGQVWIKDGKLLAIPKNKVVNKALVAAVIAGKRVRIEMEPSLTYFDPALKLDN